MAPRRGGRPGILGNYFWSILPQSQFNFFLLSNKKTEVHPVRFNIYVVTWERPSCSWFLWKLCFFSSTTLCVSAVGARSAGGALFPVEGKKRLGSWMCNQSVWHHCNSIIGRRQARHPWKHGVQVGVKSPWAWPLGPLLEWGWCRAGRGLVLLLRAQLEAGLVVG